MPNQPFDAGGVYAYAVLPPGQQWPTPDVNPGPFGAPTYPYYTPPTDPTLYGLELRIDALSRRCDELQRLVDALAKIEAKRAPVETEPTDCIVVSDFGMKAYRMKESAAREYVRKQSTVPGIHIMRLVPLESSK